MSDKIDLGALYRTLEEIHLSVRNSDISLVTAKNRVKSLNKIAKEEGYSIEFKIDPEKLKAPTVEPEEEEDDIDYVSGGYEEDDETS